MVVADNYTTWSGLEVLRMIGVVWLQFRIAQVTGSNQRRTVVVLIADDHWLAFFNAIPKALPPVWYCDLFADDGNDGSVIVYTGKWSSRISPEQNGAGLVEHVVRISFLRHC